MYNADVLLGAADARRSAATGALAPVLQDVDRVSAAEPVPHRRHARDVHARRLHARRRRDHDRLVRAAASTTSTTFGGGFDVRATTSPASPIGDMRAALAARPGRATPADFRVVSSQSVAARQGAPGRARRRSREPYLVHGADARVPRAHDLRPRRHGARLRLRRGRLARAPRRTRASPSSTRSSSRASRTTTSAPPPKFQLERLLPRGPDVRARSRSRCATRRRAGSVRADGDRRALRHARRSLMAGIWTSQATLAPTFGDRVAADRPPVRARARASTRARRRRRSSRRSWRTACRPTRCRSCSPTPSRRASRSTG